jgi:hypothetical protein
LAFVKYKLGVIMKALLLLLVLVALSNIGCAATTPRVTKEIAPKLTLVQQMAMEISQDSSSWMRLKVTTRDGMATIYSVGSTPLDTAQLQSIVDMGTVDRANVEIVRGSSGYYFEVTCTTPTEDPRLKRFLQTYTQLQDSGGLK